MSSISISENLALISQRIERAAKASVRKVDDIVLVAVSKAKPASLIEQAARAGARVFGENYVGEALEKIAELSELIEELGLEFHFIGGLQSNKVKEVVGRFSLIHSVDRLSLAKAINKEAKKRGISQSVLVQVNISREASKGGILEEELEEFLSVLYEMDNMSVSGLMCIGDALSEEKRENEFRRMEALFCAYRAKLNFTVLSMGMSSDFSPSYFFWRNTYSSWQCYLWSKAC